MRSPLSQALRAACGFYGACPQRMQVLSRHPGPTIRKRKDCVSSESTASLGKGGAPSSSHTWATSSVQIAARPGALSTHAAVPTGSLIGHTHAARTYRHPCTHTHTHTHKQHTTRTHIHTHAHTHKQHTHIHTHTLPHEQKRTRTHTHAHTARARTCHAASPAWWRPFRPPLWDGSGAAQSRAWPPASCGEHSSCEHSNA